MRTFIQILLFSTLLISQQSFGSRIIVASDEWATSNVGFANSPDVADFVLNIASLFSNGSPGQFHAYSSNFSLTQSSLANTLTSAGHAWTTGTGITFDLLTLSSYDGIFLALGADGYDANVLADYVNSGGNVYIAGGTSSNAAGTAGILNPFLNQFGLGFESSIIPGGGYNEVITSSHPIFNNVGSLYQNGGQGVLDLDLVNPLNLVLEYNQSGANGMYAIYDTSAIPVPAAIWLFGTALIGFVGMSRRGKVA